MISIRSRSGGEIVSSAVGGADEEHLRQVERQIEIVIAEVVVLLGIEHLEQRRLRIAAEIGADLVDLVDHHHRIARAGIADARTIVPGIAPM